MSSFDPMLPYLGASASPDYNPDVWDTFEGTLALLGYAYPTDPPLMVLVDKERSTFLALRWDEDDGIWEDQMSIVGISETCSQDDYEILLTKVPHGLDVSHGVMLFDNRGLDLDRGLGRNYMVIDSPIVRLGSVDDMVSRIGGRDRWRVRNTLKTYADFTEHYDSPFDLEMLEWCIARNVDKREGAALTFAVRQLVFTYSLYQHYPERFTTQCVRSPDGTLVSVALAMVRQGMPRFNLFASLPDYPNLGTYSVTRLAEYLHQQQTHTHFDPHVHVFLTSLGNPYSLYKKVLTSESLDRPLYAVAGTETSTEEWTPPYLQNGVWVQETSQ